MKLPARRPFFYTLFIATATVLAVWFLGLRQDWSVFKESLISLTILSGAFLSFLSVSLYQGVWVHDNFGNLAEHIRRVPFPEHLSGFDAADLDLDFDAGEGCGAIILGLLAWLVVAVVAVVLLWLFAAIAWAVFIILSAVLYWIFFRALRFALRHGRECRGRLVPSIRYAFLYTVVYMCWLYTIVLVAHYLA
ncbi:hypothetical protein [Hymenobacter endophyticus]|uniref:Uncharacterized protein n=1 Tax=Hymenobacter endophyticus TaxID=3076335 RepID=A0ABU3TMF5_9BACT|nr:hypothetical protein [Hymenobacter endophyticus]MDU0372563.1 hypothetical protein [Hymenobacter endophyticus]